MPAPLKKPWPVIAAKAASGATLEDLAAEHDIPLGTLKARSAREDWKQIGREGFAEATGMQPSRSGSVQPYATKEQFDPQLDWRKRGNLAATKAACIGAERIAESDPDEILLQAPTLLTLAKTIAVSNPDATSGATVLNVAFIHQAG